MKINSLKEKKNIKTEKKRIECMKMLLAIAFSSINYQSTNFLPIFKAENIVYRPLKCRFCVLNFLILVAFAFI